MDFINEIEFFEFVPITYVSNLIKKTTEKLEEILEKENIPNKKEILTALAKNFQIFEVYVLKSIFKFPRHFLFERKLTDFTCDTEIKDLLNGFIKVIEEEEFLKKEISEKEKELELRLQENKEYDILFSCEEEFKKIFKKIKDMENLCSETETSFKRLEKQTNTIMRRNKLDEFKELKDAMWEKEKAHLFENVSLQKIVFYNKNI